jgi:hypothetical protein
MFSNIRKDLREKLGIEPQSTTTESGEPTEEDLAKAVEEATKHEYRLNLILTKIRALYFEHKLVGSVEISSSLFMTSSSIDCDIDGSSGVDEGAEQDSQFMQKLDGEDKKLPVLVKLVLAAANKMIRSLKIRASHYRFKTYKEDITLSGSAGIDPTGYAGFSISCSATVTSLLESPATGKGK